MCQGYTRPFLASTWVQQVARWHPQYIFFSALQGKLRIDGNAFIFGKKTHKKFALYEPSPWPSGCNGPQSRNACGCLNQRTSRLCAGSRPSPPGHLVLHCSHVRQRMLWNADNWSLHEAREVIPQPQLQPITSKEIRKCLQSAQSSRAPRKPFLFYFSKKKKDKETKKPTRKKKKNIINL